MQREPESYVWGTNWSLADPGFQAVPDSARAAGWSRRLGKQTFETTLGTDRFLLRLVYHSIRSRTQGKARYGFPDHPPILTNCWLNRKSKCLTTAAIR
jgi:hypothetical protein